MRLLACLIVAGLWATPAARADEFDLRVTVLTPEGSVPEVLGPLGTDVQRALTVGALLTTPDVFEVTETFGDAATAAGCTTDDPGCGHEVIQALGVDQILTARLVWRDDHGVVEVSAITLDTRTISRADFVVSPDTRDADLDAIRQSVPGMLGLRVRPADKPAVPVTVTVVPPVARAPSRVPPAMVVGGGVVMVGGVIAWALAAQLQRQIDDAPVGTPAELEEVVALEDRTAFRAMVGNVMVIAGALATAAGGVWWYADRRGRGRTTVEIAPAPDGAVVTLGGSW